MEQTEVAKAVGDTQPNVARWERGRIPKEDNTLRRLAAFYGVEFVWLRYGEGPKMKPSHPPAQVVSGFDPIPERDSEIPDSVPRRRAVGRPRLDK